jgi:hypothetical protein
MKTRDCPLFVGIAPATLRGGLCLAGLITLGQNATWTGGAGTGFLETVPGIGAQSQSLIHPISHINSYTAHATYLSS